jgi:hypothetical protein
VLIAHSVHWYVEALGAHRQAIAIVLYAELAGSDPPEVAPCKLLGSYYCSWSAPASFWGLTLEKLLGSLLGDFSGKLPGNALGLIYALGILITLEYSGHPILLLA